MLISLTEIKRILGLADTSETDAQATLYINAVEAFFDNYFGLKMIKTNFTEEAVTMPYGLSRMITPKYLPVNSVSEIKLLLHTGQYAPIEDIPLSVGRGGVELLINFRDINIRYSQWHDLIKPSLIPAKISAVKLSYNAGLYDSWDDESVNPLIKALAPMILKYMFGGQMAGNFKSETMGTYAYSYGDIIKGLPASISLALDGIKL